MVAIRTDGMASEPGHDLRVANRTGRSLGELLRWRGEHQAAQLAYTFLRDGGQGRDELTYGELDQRARALAALLQQQAAPGDRALLLCPPGLDYLAAFFGCLYARVIAVPVYPPRRNRSLARLGAIRADAGATVALASNEVVASATPFSPELGALPWLAADDLSLDLASSWRESEPGPEELAFLQYTSGSTGTPKGVMVSHGNLLANLETIRRHFRGSSATRCVTWLPPYHDMGLIGGLLEGVYGGFPVTLLSPVAFLQHPYRWLEAMSRTRGTVSGGPTFAYDLCVQRIMPEQRATLELESWDVAFVGAEPIRRETLDRFAAAFASCGFRREAFFPCYGLAEATLFVAGGPKGGGPTVKAVDGAALEEGHIMDGDREQTAGVQDLVASGAVPAEQRVRIVDPASATVCPPGRVGEIWVSGESVARGYWNRSAESEETFGAVLPAAGEGSFLRTGDLGFVDDGQLFVTGRIKDLIILHGRNLYPQDIELTVEQSHLALRPGGGAAFSVEADGEEQLVVVQEVRREHRNCDVSGVVDAIRRGVADQHEAHLHAVVLIKPGSLPKTSSGKKQRQQCRANFLDDGLEVVGRWVARPPRRTEDRAVPSTADVVAGWLRAWIADELGLEVAAIDTNKPFGSFGLDSLTAVSLAGELEGALGRPISPTLAWDYPTIGSLALHLAGEPKHRGIDSMPISSASPGARQCA